MHLKCYIPSIVRHVWCNCISSACSMIMYSESISFEEESFHANTLGGGIHALTGLVSTIDILRRKDCSTVGYRRKFGIRSQCRSPSMMEKYSSCHRLVVVEMTEECSVETTFDFIVF